MMMRLLIAMAIGALATSSADAQIFARRARVEVRTAPSMPAEARVIPTVAAAETAGASSCVCGSPIPGHCNGICTAPPTIVPNHCPPEQPVCHKIPRTLTPINSTCVCYDFYGPPKMFQSMVEVPVIREECRETWKFETIHIPLPCCTVTVCVPCEKCFTKSKVCVKEKKTSKLEAYMREDKTIDVYVLDVPGMPTKYVERLMLGETEYKNIFGSNSPVPTPPLPRDCTKKDAATPIEGQKS